MAISSGQLEVGLEPTLIDGTYNSNFRLVLQNMNNDDTIFLGDENVTAATGLQLLKFETLTLEMNPLESIYAISTKAGLKLGYLKQV
jgi:hypothetical protein